jgi:two-component system sensor histidine kinase UhpB
MHGGRRRFVVAAIAMMAAWVQLVTARTPPLPGADQVLGFGLFSRGGDSQLFEVAMTALGLGASIAVTAIVCGLLIHRPSRRRTEQARRNMDQKDHKGQVEDLTRRLINAQEAERAHLARELHDDIGQQLAGLSIAVSGVKRRREVQENPDLHAALVSLQQRTDALTDAIRRLSHHLHPSLLDHASLGDVLKVHCREFGRQHNIAMTVEAGPDLQGVDAASALTVYRVAQEALHNVAKHANAHSVRIALRATDDAVIMSIADDGRGFDYREVQRRGTGLGLRSIEERARLARGRINIDSAAGVGTTLSVQLPIAHQAASSRSESTEH